MTLTIIIVAVVATLLALGIVALAACLCLAVGRLVQTNHILLEVALCTDPATRAAVVRRTLHPTPPPRKKEEAPDRGVTFSETID